MVSMTRRTPLAFLAALATLALIASLSPGAAAGAGPERIEPDGPAPWDLVDEHGDLFAQDLWFVEFAEEPTARGGVPAEHANERAHLNAQANQQGVDFTVRRDFTGLWNGLSVRADRSEVGALSRLDGVDAIYPVALIEQPEPEETDPALETALAMTGADHAQDLGLTGEGLSVAIVDTGIDYNHPDLGGHGDTDVVYTAGSEDDRTLTDADGEQHSRITHGWDYVGAGFDASDPDADEPDPNPDPMDPHGHGTHVAGIAGANAADADGVTGVAPGVTFGAYKIFDIGSSTADIIVEALEDAYEDGMDIVNMSLGASLQWGQEYPTSEASNTLAADGVAVINSAGNDAALGTWSLSAPANAHDIISVASADNTFLEARAFEVDQLDDDVPFLRMTGALDPPEEGESEPVAWLGRACVDTEGDELLDEPDGQVALIVRGDCTFAEKYDAAVDAGATGVVIYNNVPGLFAGTVAGADHEGEVWGVGITNTDGEALVGLIEDDDEVILGFTEGTMTVPSPTGGLVSSFSSYGQELELEFGPSVLAPGGLITSTYPLELNEYAMLSGTSMSAPHVAGAVALLLESEPDLDPFQVRDRLQNTGEPVVWWGNPDLGFLDQTQRQGAGMMRIDQTVQAEQRVEPGQIPLGDGDAPVEVEVTIHNDGSSPVRYDVGHDAALATAVSTYAPGAFATEAQVEADRDTVRIRPGGSADVTLTVIPPATGMPNHQFGGYVTLTPDDDDATVLRVPYVGFEGDYQEQMPLLGYWDFIDGDPGFAFVEQEPHLSRLDRHGNVERVDEGARFNVSAQRYPVIEAFFGHSPHQVTVTAIEHDTGEEHTVEVIDHHPRSPDPETRHLLVWDGTVLDEDGERVIAPSGDYTLRLEALRTLGDPADADHVDTWESPTFGIRT